MSEFLENLIIRYFSLNLSLFLRKHSYMNREVLILMKSPLTFTGHGVSNRWNTTIL